MPTNASEGFDMTALGTTVHWNTIPHTFQDSFMHSFSKWGANVFLCMTFKQDNIRLSRRVFLAVRE